MPENQTNNVQELEGLKIKDKNIVSITDPKKAKKLKFAETDDGDYQTEINGNTYIISDELYQRLFPSAEFDESTFTEIFEKLGESAALRAVVGWKDLIGKDTKPQDLINATNQQDFNDVYNLAFEKKGIGVIKDEFKNRKPYDVMESVAARVAVESLKKNGKIDNDVYNKLVPMSGNTKKYKIDEIKSDQATRVKYEAVKQNFNNAFTKGVLEMQKQLKENPNEIVDPFTKKKLAEPGKVVKGVELAANLVGKVGSKIGEIVGVTENSPDIYSKMIFAMIGGGKKLWKNLKKMNAMKRFGEYKKVTVKSLKETVDKAIKEAEPLVKEEKKKAGKPAEEKPTEGQPAEGQPAEDPNRLEKP